MQLIVIICYAALLMICLALGFTIAFSLMASVLSKSNNLGTDKSIYNNLSGGFEYTEFKDNSAISTPSKVIHNPVMLEHDNNKDASYLNEKTLGTLDDEINNSNLKGISWHK